MNITNNKRKIVIIGFIIVITIISLLTYFLLKNNYKNNKYGNNISNKTLDEYDEYICNISSYEAEIEITIESNKNINKYKVKQNVNENNSVQEVIEPENIKGLKTSYIENKLVIENTQLDLKKIYENYPYIEDNSLFLTDFINKYKDGNNNIEKEDNLVIFSVINNKYIEKLYLDVETGNPAKLTIQDDNKKDRVYILYNEIELNNN